MQLRLNSVCNAVPWFRQRAGFDARSVHVRFGWRKWLWDRYFSQYFSFPLSLSFHQCPIPIFDQKDKRANPGSLETKQCSFGNPGTLEGKLLSGFQGQHDASFCAPSFVPLSAITSKTKIYKYLLAQKLFRAELVEHKERHTSCARRIYVRDVCTRARRPLSELSFTCVRLQHKLESVYKFW
jgi:hypothetical protein